MVQSNRRRSPAEGEIERVRSRYLFPGSDDIRILEKRNNYTLRDGVLHLTPPSHPVAVRVPDKPMRLQFEARFKTDLAVVMYIRGVHSAGLRENVRLVWKPDGTLELLSGDQSLLEYTDNKDKRRSGCTGGTPDRRSYSGTEWGRRSQP